jgi:hypothetical protein
MCSRPAVLLVAVLLSGGLVACGGGDDGAEPSPSPTSASPTPSPTPTETPLTGDALLSKSAVLTAADLGAEWKEHTPAVGAEGAAPDGCLAKAGALEGLVKDGRYEGAIFQRGTATRFARADGYTFETEDAAKAMVAALLVESYGDCRVEGFSKEYAASAGAAEGGSYRLAERADAKGPGEGFFELQLTYQFQALVDGEVQDANGVSTDTVYRKGRTVSVVLYERAFAEGEGDEVETAAFDEVVAGARAAIARVSG